ncbi:hypothetical protein [Clostridium massiliamazoniense]|uniref:hypothetical protein n=1 Tax=Clostridium massiliamazoniense TaxID=1347366 RepID=UPI0006D806E8|nr:hypothetical protein [Clostridium massiliamazoniense]
MSLVIYEIKKLFNIKSIMVTLLGAVLIWFLFIDFDIKYFPNGIGERAAFNISEEMLKNYGTTVDEKEFEDFISNTKKIEEELNKEILNNETMIKYGIKSYKELKAFEENAFKNHMTEEEQKIFNEISNFTIGNELSRIIAERNKIIESYKGRNEDIPYLIENLSNKALERYKEVEGTKERTSPLSYGILNNYNNIIISILGLVIVTVFFMVSPIFIEDKKSKVDYLQYSSKKGRGVFKSKLIAGFLTVIIVTSIEILIMGVLYSTNNTLQFWNCSVNSIFVSQEPLWFDMTFGQYIIITMVFVYIIAMITGIISMYVSSKANSYITLIGVNIIILGIVFYLGFIGIDNFGTIYLPKFLQLSVYGVFLVVIGILSFLILKNRKMKVLD